MLVKVSTIFELSLFEFNTNINISKAYSEILELIVSINLYILLNIVLFPIISKSEFTSLLKFVHVSILKVLIFFDNQPITYPIVSSVYFSGGNSLKNNPKSLTSLIFSPKLSRY